MHGERLSIVHFGSSTSRTKAARSDLLQGLGSWSLWASLGWLDVKQRYRRAVLGPFWITISTGVLVVALGTIYSGIFNQNVASFLPYLAAGFIVWNFCTATINESALTFIQAEGLIKQGGLPLSLHVFRTVFRNFVVNAHNLSVMAVLYVWKPSLVTWNLGWLVPGLILMLANLAWMSLLVGVLCTRFRDLAPIVSNLLQVFFFVTPIMYSPESLPQHLNLIVTLNPFFYLIEVVRQPLLGASPPSGSYAALLALGAGGTLLTFLFYSRTRSRIAYWL